MAIQPIDLQTLYTQMAKVGKQQGAEQQMSSTVRDAQQQQNKIDAQKRLNSVQVVAADNNGELRINKDGQSKEQELNHEEKEKQQDGSKETKDKDDEYIKDPYLGQRVDISG